jgi:hypothetical protein
MIVGLLIHKSKHPWLFHNEGYTREVFDYSPNGSFDILDLVGCAASNRDSRRGEVETEATMLARATKELWQ